MIISLMEESLEVLYVHGSYVKQEYYLATSKDCTNKSKNDLESIRMIWRKICALIFIMYNKFHDI